MLNTPLRGTRFLWMAAGCPAPLETDGTPIHVRDLKAEAERERKRIAKQLADLPGGNADARSQLERALGLISDAPRCASCGEPATNRLSDAISDSFTTVKNESRAWPFGGKLICQACLFCCKTMAFRCSLFFARLPDEHGRGGVWFVPIRPIPGWPETKPDALSALLSPPPAPFVAGLPLYGIDHGGEANAQRCLWPWDGDGEPASNARIIDAGPRRAWLHADPLIKLQSKHTALYTDVSFSAERYRLQVDDAGEVTVDVALWRSLREVCEALLRDMRNAGVGATDARDSLTSLRPPFGFAIATSVWRERTAPLRPHTGAHWWPVFTSLLTMPELVKQQRPQKADKPAEKAPTPVVLAPAPAAPAKPPAPSTGQISLF